MSTDYMHYDAMVLRALRDVVRQALQQTVDEGLKGDHHFFISIRTSEPGVQISDSLRSRHPEELTIVLQHRFWDLEVDDQGFSVELSFNNVREWLRIPFSAVISFMDPAVNFLLPFHTEQEISEGVTAAPKESPVVPADDSQAGGEGYAGDPQKGQSETGQVVSLEAFRKK